MQLAAPFPETNLPWATRVVRAIAEAMFADGTLVPPARLDAVAIDVVAFLGAASWPVRLGLRAALVLLWLAPIVLFAHARTLSGLTLSERVRVLERVERSRFAPLCLAFVGWRTIATLVFYEHPDELRAMGYASDERRRHLRTLPVVGPGVPLESGVRLSPGAADDTPAEGVPAVRGGAKEGVPAVRGGAKGAIPAVHDEAEVA